MKRLSSAFLCLLLCTTVWADRLKSMEGVSMAIPSSFKPLTKQQIATKFPRSRPPKAAYGNASMTVTVAVSKTGSPLEASQLPQFKKAMKGVLIKQPGVKWESDSIETINGKRWIRFLFTSKAVDQRIRNEMLMTELNGEAVMMNINATVKDYPRYRADLTRLKNSLKI